MPLSRQPVVCERVREQASLEVDGELSQLERAMLAAHVARCAECRAYRSELQGLTRALRSAPLEAIAPVTVRRYGRSRASTRFQAGAAAAMAFAVVGIATQVVDGRPEAASGLSHLRVVHFQTQSELEQEQALIERSLESSSTGSGEATVR